MLLLKDKGIVRNYTLAPSEIPDIHATSCFINSACIMPKTFSFKADTSAMHRPSTEIAGRNKALLLPGFKEKMEV